MQSRHLFAVCALAGTLAFGGGWGIGWLTDPGIRSELSCVGCGSGATPSPVTTSARATPSLVRTARPPAPPPRTVTVVVTVTPSVVPTTSTAPSTTVPPTTDPPPPSSAPTTSETPLLPLIGR